MDQVGGERGQEQEFEQQNFSLTLVGKLSSSGYENDKNRKHPDIEKQKIVASFSS